MPWDELPLVLRVESDPHATVAANTATTSAARVIVFDGLGKGITVPSVLGSCALMSTPKSMIRNVCGQW